MDKTVLTAAKSNADLDDRRTVSRNALARLAYSPSEGAQVLGISRSKIYELISAHHLKVIKLGSRTLVLHSELLRFVRSLDARGRRRSSHTAQPEASG
jgi:excisionase family DNA binding protein